MHSSQSGFQSNHSLPDSAPDAARVPLPCYGSLGLSLESLFWGHPLRWTSLSPLMEVAGKTGQWPSEVFVKCQGGRRVFLCCTANRQRFLQVPSDARRQAQPAFTLRRRIQQVSGRLPAVTTSQDTRSGEVWACGSALSSPACQAPCASPQMAPNLEPEDIASSFTATELESDLVIL